MKVLISITPAIELPPKHKQFETAYISMRGSNIPLGLGFGRKQAIKETKRSIDWLYGKILDMEGFDRCLCKALECFESNNRKVPVEFTVETDGNAGIEEDFG